MSQGKVGFGIFLIVVGIFSLLINMGFIDWSIWHSLLVLWPLILIVIGINIMFRHIPIVGTISWILFLAILILYAYFSNSIGPISHGFRS